MTTALVIGIALAIASGIMNGIFTLPMRYLGAWEWENVWSLFILVACILLPAVVLLATVPGAMQILAAAPAAAERAALLGGFFWGFGAIMFGQCVSALGIALANTIVLAVSSCLGSLLPLLLLDPSKLVTATGHFLIAGTAVAVVGIAFAVEQGSYETARRKVLAQRLAPWWAMRGRFGSVSCWLRAPASSPPFSISVIALPSRSLSRHKRRGFRRWQGPIWFGGSCWAQVPWLILPSVFTYSARITARRNSFGRAGPAFIGWQR
jgi:hypothetical protein